MDEINAVEIKQGPITLRTGDTLSVTEIVDSSGRVIACTGYVERDGVFEVYPDFGRFVSYE